MKLGERDARAVLDVAECSSRRWDRLLGKVEVGGEAWGTSQGDA